MQNAILLRGQTESCEDTLHGGAGSYFPFSLTADSIGKRKQPTMGTHEDWRGRHKMSYVILVVFAHQTSVGQLCKFQIQHEVL